MTQQASTQPSSPPAYVYDSNAYAYGAPQNQFAPPIGRTSPLLTPCALFEGETGLDYFLARYYSAAQGRFTTPDEFTGGIVDPFTGQQVGQPGPLPYADITDPQTLNKYVYVRNNPLRYIDPDGHAHDGPFSLVQDWLDVMEVKLSTSVGAAARGQFGVGEIGAEATFIGAEGKLGLGGGNAEARLLHGVKLFGRDGPAAAEVNIGVQGSTRDGVSAEASARATVGTASAKLGVRATAAGVKPVSNLDAKGDFKIGGEVRLGMGVGVNINVSQGARAAQATSQAAKTTLQMLTVYLKEKLKNLQPGRVE